MRHFFLLPITHYELAGVLPLVCLRQGSAVFSSGIIWLL